MDGGGGDSIPCMEGLWTSDEVIHVACCLSSRIKKSKPPDRDET